VLVLEIESVAPNREFSVMKFDYVPLLQIQRDLHALPRTYERFQQYLRAIGANNSEQLELPSLIIMNPMGKEHVTALLDALLAMDADGIAARALAASATVLAKEPGNFKAALVVADDWKGGWTNRYATEYKFRFPGGATARGELPHWAKHFWVNGLLWSSDPASERAVREAILTAAYRTAYLLQHGPALTLRDKLAQEGHVMVKTGCVGPVLDEDDIAYTREVLAPFLGATDQRTVMECLFGDAAGQTLGFSPRGLSPWAGLALALFDARNCSHSRSLGPV
jgi:hypothetical protein